MKIVHEVDTEVVGSTVNSYTIIIIIQQIQF